MTRTLARWALSVGLAMVTFFVAAEGRAEPLRVWHAYREGGREAEALAATLRAFEASRPGITVETLSVPFEDYALKLGAAIPHGNGPDVFLDAHERLGDYRERALVQELSLDDAARHEIVDAALAAVTVGGKLYGAPLSRKCLALYLNEALVPTAPVSLDDLFDLPRAPGVFAIAHTGGSSYAHAVLASAFGADLLGPGVTYGWLSPGGERSIDWLARQTAAGRLPEDASGALVKDLFASGHALSAISGPWFAGDLPEGLRYRVVPVPPLRGGERSPSPLLTVEAAMVSARARSPLAGDLAGFLSGREASRLRAEVGRVVSALREPTDAERRDPLLVAFARAADGASPMSTSRDMRLVFEPSDRALKKVLRGDASAHDALVEAKRRWDDARRPLPARRDPTLYSIGLSLVALALAATLWARGRSAASATSIRRSLPVYAWVGPTALSVLVLVVGPLVAGALSSFFAGRGEEVRFVGLANYANILTARGGALFGVGSFWIVLLVTLLWTVANVALHVVLGVSLGLLLSRADVRAKGLLRVLLILPWAVPSYVTALAWKGMFHRQYGSINALLAALHVEPVSWFSHFSTAFSANLTTNIWLGFPFFVVVTMGAVTTVPQDVLEAATLDGATAGQRLTKVTLPLIAPILVPAIVMGATWTFNMFNVVFLVSGGEPDGATDILVSDAYRWAFSREASVGYAAAYAVLIFLLLAGFGRVGKLVVEGRGRRART